MLSFLESTSQRIQTGIGLLHVAAPHFFLYFIAVFPLLLMLIELRRDGLVVKSQLIVLRASFLFYRPAA